MNHHSLTHALTGPRGLHGAAFVSTWILLPRFGLEQALWIAGRHQSRMRGSLRSAGLARASHRGWGGAEGPSPDAGRPSPRGWIPFESVVCRWDSVREVLQAVRPGYGDPSFPHGRHVML